MVRSEKKVSQHFSNLLVKYVISVPVHYLTTLLTTKLNLLIHGRNINVFYLQTIMAIYCALDS